MLAFCVGDPPVEHLEFYNMATSLLVSMVSNLLFLNKFHFTLKILFTFVFLDMGEHIGPTPGHVLCI